MRTHIKVVQQEANAVRRTSDDLVTLAPDDSLEGLVQGALAADDASAVPLIRHGRMHGLGAINCKEDVVAVRKLVLGLSAREGRRQDTYVGLVDDFVVVARV